MQQRSKEKELFRASGIWFNLKKLKMAAGNGIFGFTAKRES